MILGLGLDVTELARIREALVRFPEQFQARILTEAERAAMPRLSGADGQPTVRAVEYVAARFAAKEAAAKALGTGLRDGVGFQGIQVLSLESGKPELFFLERTEERARAMGVVRALVSLTHGKDVAAAVVVLEGEN